MEKPIIQIRNLGKEFKTANGPVRALNDINLDINQGEILVSSVLAAQEKVLWCDVSIIWRHRQRARCYLRDRVFQR